jgi:hypothetical protein
VCSHTNMSPCISSVDSIRKTTSRKFSEYLEANNFFFNKERRRRRQIFHSTHEQYTA